MDFIDQAFAPFSKLVNDFIFFSVEVNGVALPLVVVWLGGGAIFITASLKFVNLRGFAHAWFFLLKGKRDEDGAAGEISHFEALSAALSGTIGLGNIASVPIAIALGGPGAIFWMLVAGFFAMSMKFAECALAVKYRRINPDGSVSGGPMYYIEAAFAQKGSRRVGKVLATAFALMAIGGSVSIFQINQSYAQFSRVTGFDAPFLFGLVMAGLGAGFVILFVNYHEIPSVVRAIIEGAFGLDAVGGGAVGAIINGVKRATYSSEAGTGSAAIAHSAVKTKNPLTEGYVALVEPFIDTIIVCLTTGLIVLVTGAWRAGVPMGIEMTSFAFESVFPWFSYILAASAVLFAFSMAVSWAYYGSKAVGYLSGGGPKIDTVYKLALCAMLSLGATVELAHIVNFIDAMLFGMAVPNLIAVYLLLPELRRDLEAYEKSRKRARPVAGASL